MRGINLFRPLRPASGVGAVLGAGEAGACGATALGLLGSLSAQTLFLHLVISSEIA